MKIALKRIKWNPFRDRKAYPIETDRKEGLRRSIQQTGFWDNLLVRPNNNGYELAYGHHRLVVALEELGGDYQADISVKDLSDELMLKIMIQENETLFQHNPTVLRENVAAAKRFLEESGPGSKKATIEKIASFTGMPVGRVRMGLRLITAANPKMELAAASVTHASEIAKSKELREDKETAVGLAKLSKGDDGLTKRETADVVEILEHTKKPDRKEVLKAVEKRRRDVTAKQAARHAQILAAGRRLTDKERRELEEERRHYDANKALGDFASRLSEINMGMKDLFKIWDELDSEIKESFVKYATRFVSILKTQSQKNKEWTQRSKGWKLLTP